MEQRIHGIASPDYSLNHTEPQGEGQRIARLYRPTNCGFLGTGRVLRMSPFRTIRAKEREFVTTRDFLPAKYLTDTGASASLYPAHAISSMKLKVSHLSSIFSTGTVRT